MGEFLKAWFDPRPQIKELCQVVFWKDMIIEAWALAQVLVAVMFLLNTLNAVCTVSSVENYYCLMQLLCDVVHIGATACEKRMRHSTPERHKSG